MIYRITKYNNKYSIKTKYRKIKLKIIITYYTKVTVTLQSNDYNKNL